MWYGWCVCNTYSGKKSPVYGKWREFYFVIKYREQKLLYYDHQKVHYMCVCKCHLLVYLCAVYRTVAHYHHALFPPKSELSCPSQLACFQYPLCAHSVYSSLIELVPLTPFSYSCLKYYAAPLFDSVL